MIVLLFVHCLHGSPELGQIPHITVAQIRRIVYTGALSTVFQIHQMILRPAEVIAT